MRSVLSDHQAFDSAGLALGSSALLRTAAEQLAARLPAGPVVLLARTDAALMCCAAAAMLRESPTEVERAPIGRAGWTPPHEAILVEPVAPAAGLLATLRARAPELTLIVLDPADQRAPIAA